MIIDYEYGSDWVDGRRLYLYYNLETICDTHMVFYF